MEHDLITYLSRFISLTEEEAEALAEHNPVRTYATGSLLLEEGEIARTCWFILKGCVRQYQLRDGDEKTTFFYTEEDAIAPPGTLDNPAPSTFYLACVEDTTLIASDLDKIPEMYERFPKLESLSFLLMGRHYDDTKKAFASFRTTAPEKRYLNLLKTRPGLVQRVPQYQLASYLGVTPESLSRIRRRISSKASDEG